MIKMRLLLCIFFAFFLAACSKKVEQQTSLPSAEMAADTNAAETLAAENNAIESKREHLGTAWGDELTSHVREVELTRLSTTPIAQQSLRYADKDYQGRPVNSISLAAGKVSFSVVDQNGNALPIYRADQSYFLAGKEGQSYQLRYENHTGQTFEVVASVDGLDVLNGSAASRKNSGYVLNPNTTLNIEGFRKSDSAVASFTFSKPRQAYAANTDSGSVKNTGIIGTIIYELNVPKEQPVQPKNKYAPGPNAFPGDER